MSRDYPTQGNAEPPDSPPEDDRGICPECEAGEIADGVCDECGAEEAPDRSDDQIDRDIDEMEMKGWKL